MLDYDPSKRIEALRQLPPGLRVAFALLCVERALLGYRRFHVATGRGNPSIAESLAERLWLDLAGDAMTPAELQAALDAAEELVADEHDGLWHVATRANADDATSALLYAVRARASGDPLEAACAGGRLYDLADHCAQRDLGDLSPAATWTAADEARVRKHPRVQRELARQERDLSDLSALAGASPDVLEGMKARSVSEAADFLPD
jgi:uncharacterized protein YjaG (DUF416 family)